VLDFNEALDTVVDEDPLPNVSERVRSLVIGPDEKLYMTTDEGRIVRFSPRSP
jgi:glucose/arabinose dehydrogenase